MPEKIKGKRFYPDRTVIGIDACNLYQNGGMIHCVTQLQPVFPVMKNGLILSLLSGERRADRVSPWRACGTRQRV